MRLRGGFPQATVYAFEPVEETFGTLRRNVSAEERIRPFNLALGRRSRAARMRTHGLSVSNRVAGWRDYLKSGETVRMTSGDRFCAEHGIERIGFLKIDAEGYDLEVLFGFRSDAACDADRHGGGGGRHEPREPSPRSFEWVKTYLERLDYRLFLIHDQRRDTPFTGRAWCGAATSCSLRAELIQAPRS